MAKDIDPYTLEEVEDVFGPNDTTDDTEEADTGFTPKGQYYDTEYGDNPPSHIYESGMYLGDGVWVSEDFFG